MSDTVENITLDMRPIASCPGYYVTNDGRVFCAKGAKGTDIHELRPQLHTCGQRSVFYLFVRIKFGDGRVLPRPVHRLVAEAWIGPPPPNAVTRHLDNNPRNNHVSNLAWGTHLENERDKDIFGTRPRGEQHPAFKKTPLVVSKIVRERAEGRYLKDIANDCGVSLTLVKEVLREHRGAQCA